jgi:hypothetical protein
MGVFEGLGRLNAPGGDGAEVLGGRVGTLRGNGGLGFGLGVGSGGKSRKRGGGRRGRGGERERGRMEEGDRGVGPARGPPHPRPLSRWRERGVRTPTAVFRLLTSVFCPLISDL